MKPSTVKVQLARCYDALLRSCWDVFPNIYNVELSVICSWEPRSAAVGIRRSVCSRTHHRR